MNSLAKLLITLIVTLGATGKILAWHSYKPFVVENRRWMCANGLTYTILGDTIIGNQTYKKAWSYVTDDATRTMPLKSMTERYTSSTLVLALHFNSMTSQLVF